MIDQPATATDFSRWEQQARTMDEASLHYAINDCRTAAEAMRDWNPDREAYYIDQAHTFADELKRRMDIRFKSIRTGVAA